MAFSFSDVNCLFLLFYSTVNGVCYFWPVAMGDFELLSDILYTKQLII